MDTLYFHFCWELALETQAKSSSINSLGVHDFGHTQTLASFQWSGLSNQQTLLLTENCLQCQKWSTYKGTGAVSMPICAKREWPSQCRPRPFYSQPKQPPSAHCLVTMPTHLPYPAHFASKTYLQNGLCQLITCGQSCMTSTLVISG